MEVAFLLTHPPGTPQFARLREEVDHVLRTGHEVGIFVDVDGVVDGLVAQDEYNRPMSVTRRRDQRQEMLDDLIERGARVTICKVCATQGRFFPDGVSKPARLGDYGDLAEMLARADRFVAL